MKLRKPSVLLASIFLLISWSPLHSNDSSSEELKSLPQKVEQSLKTLISIELDQVPLSSALEMIAKKGGFKLNYNRSRIPSEQLVSIQMQDTPALAVLSKILQDTRTELKVSGNGDLIIVPAYGPATPPSGTCRLRGLVIDRSTRDPLPGAIVELSELNITTVTDINGKFDLKKIISGKHCLEVSFPGFHKFERDIALTPGNAINFQAELQLQSTEVNVYTLDVWASSKSDGNPNSTVSLHTDEVQRSPGSAGDINRSIKSFPGITFVADSNNDLIVRGGSPLENRFYVDGIEIPTPDHYAYKGLAGGIFSIFNRNLVRGIDFQRGGFSSDYGDCLSSVTEIHLKEGSREGFHGNLDLSILMSSAALEGPLGGDRGSWLVSFRRSSFNHMKNLGLIDLNVTPKSQDSQIKLTYDISPSQKFTLLNVYSSGSYDESGNNLMYEDNGNYLQNVLGISLKSIWSERWISNTTFAVSYYGWKMGENFGLYDVGFNLWEVKDSLRIWNLTTSHILLFNPKHRLMFGAKLKQEADRMEQFVDPRPYFEQKPSGGFHVYSMRATKASLYCSYVMNPLEDLNATLGVRGDYFSLSDVFHLSPRVSVNYQFNNRFSLHGGFGVYVQSLPPNYLTYASGSRRLKEMKAVHWILGFDWRLPDGLECAVEVYQKNYHHMPVNPYYPWMLATDWFLDRSVDNIDRPTGFFLPPNLTSGSKAFSRGIEFMVRKNLTVRHYGVVSLSLFRSRYRDLLGEWRNRLFDNRFVFNVLWGFFPRPSWEISLKWTLMGGAPYTPIDLQRTMQYGVSLPDYNQVHIDRYPDYHVLNLRIQKRFEFSRVKINAYLDVLNLYDQENVSYYWGSYYGDIFEEEQLDIIPIFGLEILF